MCQANLRVSLTLASLLAFAGCSSSRPAVVSDTTPPDPPVITSPTTGTVSSTPIVRVVGDAEAGSTVELSEAGTLLSSTATGTDGTWSTDLPSLPEGEHRVIAHAIDDAGNRSDPSAELIFTIEIPPTSFALGGSVSGLTGILQLSDGSETLTVSTDGNFAFTTPVPINTAYSVTIAAQPATQTCMLTSGSGTASGPIPSVSVSCTTDVTDAYENNDTVGTAFVSSLDTTYSNAWLSGNHDPQDHHAISLVDDMTTVLWDVTAAFTILTNSTGASVDVTLSFLTPNGVEIAQEALSLSTGSDAITFPLRSASAGEDYVVLVSTSDGDVDILYTLEVTRTATALPISDCSEFTDGFEPNDTPGTASPIELDTTYVAYQCEPEDVVDHYAFNVPAGDPIKVTANVTYLSNEGLGSLGFDGYASVGSGSSVGLTNSIEFTFNPGDYVFTQSFGASGEPLAYQLELVTSAPCMDDASDLPPNDDDFPAGAITVTEGNYMATGCRLDSDYRTIALNAGDTLNITADTASNQFMGVRIFGTTGLVCDNQSGSGPVMASCLAEFTGDYDFVVSTSQSDEDYTVDVDVMEGVPPGSPNLMFITSTTFNLGTGGGDLAGADAFCNSVAAAANGGTGLPGTYAAWLSTTTTPAVDRFAGSRGWVRTDGREFGDTPANINTGRIFYPPNVDENGNMVSKGIFGATGDDGVDTCGDWQVSTGFARGGPAWGANWKSFGDVSCAGTRLYCFGVGQDVPVAPPAANGRIAFISTGILTLTDMTDNLAAADVLCQANATTASLSGTFLALMATQGSSAASRFVTGLPWKRIDNVLLTATADDFLNGSDLLAPITTGPGMQSPKLNNGVWTGAVDRISTGTTGSTCNDWMSTSGTSAIVGRSGFADENNFDDFVGADCDATNNFVYCLEQ